MSFEDVAAVLGRAFGLELKVVEDTTVFEVSGEDGGTKVQVLVQYVGERKLVLMSADLGEPPSDCGERLFRTMLEANHMFSGTEGASFCIDNGRAKVERLICLEGFWREGGKSILMSIFRSVQAWREENS